MRYNESVHMPKIDFELSSIAYGPEATVKRCDPKMKSEVGCFIRRKNFV